MERFSPLYVIREMLIKTVSYRYPVTEAAKICSTDHGESWWGRTAGPLTAGRNGDSAQPVWKAARQFLTKPSI